jgi:hypothetical protein
VSPDVVEPAARSAALQALQVLKARYFRLLDTQRWDELAGLFTDPAHIDVSGEAGGEEVATSPAAFVAGVERALRGARSVHHGHMPELLITSPTTATGVWAMEDRIWWPEGSPVRRLHGWGHYHERYRRAADPAVGVDGWRIESMRLERLERRIDRS